MAVTQVAADKLREHLDAYLDGNQPLAVTRHGETVGFYLPVRRATPEVMAAYRAAGQKVSEFLDAIGEDEDSIAEDFERWRRERKHEQSRKTSRKDAHQPSGLAN